MEPPPYHRCLIFWKPDFTHRRELQQKVSELLTRESSTPHPEHESNFEDTRLFAQPDHLVVLMLSYELADSSTLEDLRSTGQICKIGQIDQIGQIGQICQIGQIGQIGQICQIGQIGQKRWTQNVQLNCTVG